MATSNNFLAQMKITMNKTGKLVDPDEIIIHAHLAAEGLLVSPILRDEGSTLYKMTDRGFFWYAVKKGDAFIHITNLINASEDNACNYWLKMYSYSTAFKELRDDVDVNECTTAQLKYKSVEE